LTAHELNATRQKPLATVVFALIGTALLMIAVVLGLLGSFAFIAIASVGCFFIAAALVARASRSPSQRAAAVGSIVGLALVVFGMVASPLFYLGWACLGAGLISLAASIVALRRERT
jgi:uncharacterized protein (DUF58 family)